MAASTMTSPTSPPAENLTVDLDALLARLSSTLLSPTADTAALNTPYARARISANVEYARTLLLRLDHLSTLQKTATRKAAVQEELAQKRDLVKKLNARLVELNSLAAMEEEEEEEEEDAASSSSDEDAEDEERVREFAPAVKTSDTLDLSPSASHTAAETLTTALRARKPNALDANSTPDASSTSALFARSTSSSAAAAAPPSTSQILEDATRDQDVLTSSLVALAQSLKTSSLQFASSLESEKTVLKRAEAGLDKNAMGMESAGNRMTALRRMTEGQGWWGRVKLYAIIAALWVAAFLLVFLGPKLRF